MAIQQILIDDQWTDSDSAGTFTAVNPATNEPIPDQYPVSTWDDIDRALTSAAECSRAVRNWPGARFAAFLNAYADEIEHRAEALVEMAHAETALPVSPRLKDVELPRTTNQLRLAAKAADSGVWKNPIIDTKAGIRSCFGPIGPVIVFGPNNFPFAFNSVAGGDFAAAIAAGNPVIAKANSSHPGTTRLLAEAADAAATKTQMPAGFVQLLYRTSHADGERMVADPRTAAVGYTGARNAGLVLKEAADKTGTPIYLELSSINPVFILEGALAERSEALADEFTGSCLMGTGQFCTNPGVVVLPDSEAGRKFTVAVGDRFSKAAVGTLLSDGVLQGFAAGLRTLLSAGAELVTGGETGGGKGISFQNTLLKVSGDTFLGAPEKFQTEAFGNASLFVLAKDVEQMREIAEAMEGNLTGCIYSATDAGDDESYDVIEPALRSRVGRLLNDKMPTGVAVSPAMNHGGPFPATGHPAFTAVGIPTSIARFGMLQCYDNVRPHRLPDVLQDKNPHAELYRCIDGKWTTESLST